MILTLLSLVLLLTGVNTSSSESQELCDDQQKSSYSSAEIPGGNIMPDEPSDLYNNTSNQTNEENARTCIYQDVLNFLNLTKNNDLLTMSRPTSDYKIKTKVSLLMTIHAILDMRESDQTFISYVRIIMNWHNPFLKWDPNDFCGISTITVPSETLWIPDLKIKEMVEKDKSPNNPFLKVSSDGLVVYMNEQLVISSCRMRIYKFPFDVQSCNISFRSFMHLDDELELVYFGNHRELTHWSHESIQTQYEWLFVKQSVTKTEEFQASQTIVVYTITMKRRSSLYVANFLLPVLFFLCLDFASLLMSEGGDKIGFKVTVLLAVTVMQLILNEILPVSSDNIPLIVVYCIGVFGLMLISLMETILIKYLMEKDSQDSNTDNDSRMTDEREIKKSSSISENMTDQTSSVYKEGSSSQSTELVLVMEKVLEELKEIKLLGIKKQETPGYWTRLANGVNKVFNVVYVTAVVVFLFTLFPLWISDSFKLFLGSLIPVSLD